MVVLRKNGNTYNLTQSGWDGCQITDEALIIRGGGKGITCNDSLYDF